MEVRQRLSLSHTWGVRAARTSASASELAPTSSSNPRSTTAASSFSESFAARSDAAAYR